MATTNEGTKYLAQAVGRRKSSIARIYLKEGTGKIFVNKRDIRNYFPKATNRYVINQPLNLLKLSNTYDLNINVKGGGTTGQAGAIRHGIARVLFDIDENNRKDLKTAGFLTRDSRKVERKKAGLRGARRRFQFSKR
jgi:small subunit ribosomal protein S9